MTLNDLNAFQNLLIRENCMHELAEVQQSEQVRSSLQRYLMHINNESEMHYITVTLTDTLTHKTNNEEQHHA